MNVKEFSQKIVWLGHDGFRLDASKTIYIDPFQINTNQPADIILISHEHFDHCSPEDIEKIQTEKTIIITEKDSAKKLSGDVRRVEPGDTVTIEDVVIKAVPAYNTNKNFHPKSNGWLGFIVSVDGITLYHAGDTDFIPEMSGFDVDIALLPVSGTYVMTATEAVEAALAISPKLAIPMHYGAIVGDKTDATSFVETLKGKVETMVLKPA